MNQQRITELSCVHCQLPMTNEIAIHHEGNEFCCHGCKGAYELIQAAGLGSYYTKRGQSSGQAVLPPSSFNSQVANQRINQDSPEEIKSAQLLISGIHCAACVWLNEAYLLKTQGVKSATVNYSNHRANITWDDSQLSLSQIIQALSSLGYKAIIYDPKASEKQLQQQRLEDYKRFVVALFAMMNIMWLSIAEWAGYFSGMEQNVKNLLHLAQFTLATPVIFYSGLPFVQGAIKGLKNGLLGLDFQIAFSSLLIWVYSSYASLTQTGQTYYESAVMLITFVLGGKFIEKISLKNLYEFSSHLGSHLGGFATKMEGGQRREKNSEDIEVGWLLESLPGERILADGIIKQGSADFDESFLSGESSPKFKEMGAEVYASSLNLNGPIHYLVTKKVDHSLAAKIASLVDEAINSKPPLQQRADKIAQVFVPVVIVLAFVNGWLWGWGTGNFEAGLMQFIALLVIACPCALSLATPISYLIGIKEATKGGIIFRKASVIEDLAQAQELFLDKTGTLTLGRPEVVNTWGSEKSLAVVLAMSEQSRHPLASAIYKYLHPNHQAVSLGNSQKETPGKGFTSEYQGSEIYLGSLDWLRAKFLVPEEAKDFIKTAHDLGHSLVAFGQHKLEYLFSFSDQFKPEIAKTITELKKMGLNLTLLSGDAAAPARAVGGQLGIKRIIAPASPTEKMEVIAQAKATGPVIMVGDGINDSPALALSDVGISLGQGAQTAIAASDLVLLGDDLKGLVQARRIAINTRKLVKLNLNLSLGYNLTALSMAFLGLVNPPIAAAAMSLSSLLVVGNAWVFGSAKLMEA